MNRSVTCVYCGALVRLDPRPDLGRLRMHLLSLHAEVVAFHVPSRWSELLEHYRVVPLRSAVVPGVVRLG